MRDIAPHPADETDRICLTVAAYLLGDPHDGLADAEALHEERVEADDVAGQSYPQQVAVQALEFQHDGANVLGPERRLQGGGLFYSLDVRHAVHASANAADALGQHRDVVIAHHRFRELLDPAMYHEAAILAAAHHLAFDVEAEMGGLVERGMEGAERASTSPTLSATSSC